MKGWEEKEGVYEKLGCKGRKGVKKGRVYRKEGCKGRKGVKKGRV